MGTDGYLPTSMLGIFCSCPFAVLFSPSPISRVHLLIIATSYLGNTETMDDGRWDGGVVFLLSMLLQLSWTDPKDPPLGAVPARLPNPPPLSNSATGAWPTAIGSRQRSLDPALLVGVCSGASREAAALAAPPPANPANPDFATVGREAPRPPVMAIQRAASHTLPPAH